MLIAILLLAGCFLPLTGSGQQHKPGLAKRYINSLLNDTTDITKPQFVFYPALSYAPETSWEAGVSGLLVFYAHRDTSNRLSEIKAYTFYTFKSQYGLHLNNSVFGHQTNWMLVGRLRYQYFPLLYFGIGPGTARAYTARVDATQLQVKQRYLRKLGRNLYAGPAIDFQRLSAVEFVKPAESALTLFPAGAAGSANLGLGASLVFDTRKNMLNVRQGAYQELTFLRYADAWGSDFSFSNIISDNRLYVTTKRNQVLAVQAFGQFNIGTTPFNQLSLMGGENLMRGYYLGRFRDNNLVAGQAEYRFLPLPLGFTKKLGAAFFAGAGSVFHQFSEVKADNFVWSAGGGLRFLVFPKKDVFSRLDVAFTPEGTGFYIFIGEAF